MSENPALTTTDGELLDAVRAVCDEHDVPAATSTEVTEKVELGSNSVRMRLNELVEEGRLSKTKRGRDALYYFDDGVENETVIPPDLEEHVVEYAEKKEMTKYEAVRDLTETGLQFALTGENIGETVEDDMVGTVLGVITAGAVVLGILTTFGSVILGASGVARDAAGLTLVLGALGVTINRSYNFAKQRGYIGRE
jgi:hypothetical protein